MILHDPDSVAWPVTCMLMFFYLTAWPKEETQRQSEIEINGGVGGAYRGQMFLFNVLNPMFNPFNF